MNINSLKGILGDAVSNEVRTLELRVGQVVRGVVLQQLPNNEATVSINGVQVRAKLEIPIMEGQASLLQVQPDSKNGQIHLKQVDPTSMGLQDPMKDILKSLNLPERQWAQELIKDLRREGFALNKETAAAFQRAAQLMPAGVNQEQWMNAAAAVFKRGLPMSELTISAMHQLQNGTPLHQLLTQLRGELIQLLQSNSHPQLQQLLTQLSSQLDQGGNLLRQLLIANATSNNAQQPQAQQAPAQQGVVSQSNMPASATTGSATATTTPTQATITGGAIASQGTVSQQSSSAASMQNPLPTQQAAAPLAATVLAANGAANEQQLLPQLMKWLGVSHESQLVKNLLNQSAGSNAALGNSNTQLPAGQPATANMANTASQQVQGNNVNSGSAPQVAQNATGAASTPSQAAQSSTASASVQQSLTVGTASNSPQNASTVGSQVSAQAAGTGTPAPANSNLSAAQPTASMPMQGDGAASANSGATATTAGATTGQATNAQSANAQASNTAPANAMQNQAATTQASTTAQAQSQVQTAQQVNTPQVQGGQVTSLPPMSPELAHAHGAHGQGSNAMSQDSLKATIMQLLQASDVPSGLRDAAQQLLHAITGQQLMMAAERNHSVFSHVTLYIPIQDGENGQTASIHVQTRRNRKGELDSDNCRIVFDLQMKTIGPTMVDMNVVNKIVTLNLWNDHPAIAPIMDTLKADIQDALQGYGYLLSSIRTTPIPLKDQEEVKKSEEGKTFIVPPDIDQLNSTRYKGVDFKI